MEVGVRLDADMIIGVDGAADEHGHVVAIPRLQFLLNVATTYPRNLSSSHMRFDNFWADSDDNVIHKDKPYHFIVIITQYYRHAFLTFMLQQCQ